MGKGLKPFPIGLDRKEDNNNICLRDEGPPSKRGPETATCMLLDSVLHPVFSVAVRVLGYFSRRLTTTYQIVRFGFFA
jgi:nitrate reductase NapE component